MERRNRRSSDLSLRSGPQVGQSAVQGPIVLMVHVGPLRSEPFTEFFGINMLDPNIAMAGRGSFTVHFRNDHNAGNIELLQLFAEGCDVPLHPTDGGRKIPRYSQSDFQLGPHYHWR